MAETIETLDFEGKAVPCLVSDCPGGRKQKVLTLASIEDITGVQRDTLRKLIDRNPKVFQGLVWSDVTSDRLSRSQGNTVVSRDGVMILLVKISTGRLADPDVEDRLVRFQRWAGNVLGEVSQTGTYAPTPKTPAEMMLLMVQQMVETERRQAAIEAEQRRLSANQDDHSERIAAIEASRDEAEKAFAELPMPGESVPDLTVRVQINRLVRAYCRETGTPFSDAWNRVYTEFRDRFHVDLKARAHGKVTPLDVAEQIQKIRTLYAVAHLLYAKQVTA